MPIFCLRRASRLSALILVDLQNDFFPGGALAVKEGDKILPAINKLLQKQFDVVIATKDWHPHNHGSFASTHGLKTGDVIDLNGLKQILWPVHCVQGSKGAEFAPGWETAKVDKIFHKGIEREIDSYSTFFDNGRKRSTGLEEFLRQKNITEIYIAGLVTDYCVKYSALDALRLGFEVYVVSDGCCAVNLSPDDEAQAYKEMRAAGAHIITSEELTKE